MSRYHLPMFLVLALLFGAPGVAGAAGTPVASSALVVPAQPGQPATGPGGSDAAFPAARGIHYGSEPGGFWMWEPTTETGGATPIAGDPLPIVLYLSGCCGNFPWPTPEEVDPWLMHLARQGYVVVAPVYNADTPTPADTLADLQARLREALAELTQPGHAAVDVAQFVVLGHSFGGDIAVPFLAAPAEGLPVPHALFLNAPFCGDCFDVQQAVLALPKGTKALVVAYEDDTVAGINQARTFYHALAALPAADRDFVLMSTDRHGEPALIADHQTAVLNVDAADWYGVWKLSDALFACALRGEWCAYALGDTPEQRTMGNWSDGVPITELQVFDDPGIYPTPFPT
jgi:hypothetical protein